MAAVQAKTGIGPLKIIIDTDPGIDDAMAIFIAFNSPEVKILGLTTVFGNVRTPTATQNALHLCEVAGRPDIPVAQGELVTLKGVAKVRIADFVHGADGLGNTHPPPPKGSALGETGPEFLVRMADKYPHEVTVVALGPLTNIAKAVALDPEFPKKVGRLLILGGAFFVNGNVNPAAEANVFGDTDAADLVFTCGADIIAIGINITHQAILTAQDLEEVGASGGRFGKYILDCSQFYLHYHQEAYGFDGVYLHDPTALLAAFMPELFTYKEGAVRVQTEGICKGATLLNNTAKLWAVPTAWCGMPTVKVAVTLDADRVVAEVKRRLML